MVLAYLVAVGPISSRYIDTSIVLVTLMLTAYFLARGTNQVLASVIFPREESPVGGVAALGSTVPLVASSTKDPGRILRRNIFDAATGSVEMQATQATAANSVEQPPGLEVIELPLDPNAPPPACGGNLRLVATMVSERRPETSLASLRNGSEPSSTKNYSEGAEIDGSKVVSIRPQWVVMRPGGGNLCSVSMFASAQGAAVAAPVAMSEPAADTGDGGSIPAADFDAGIRKISDTKYIIGRTLLNRVLADRMGLIRAARILPYEEGGRVVGVKLYGIRKNSLLGRIGLDNGDMLRTINGFDMSSPDTALEAYARLRSADRLSVAIVRHGQPITMDYTVQ